MQLKSIALAALMAAATMNASAHIMRGPDGAFHMSMTDAHIFAQHEGLRDTEWKRPGSDYPQLFRRQFLIQVDHRADHEVELAVP